MNRKISIEVSEEANNKAWEIRDALKKKDKKSKTGVQQVYAKMIEYGRSKVSIKDFVNGK